MAHITDCGQVQVIGLKKCGSSQIRKSFAGKHWELNHFDGDRRIRYATAFRNPAHRLVSCWNHLVRTRYITPADDDQRTHEFGPAVSFPEWLGWVLEHDSETLNAHMRPQALELRDLLEDTDSLIWIGQLERMRELAKKNLTEWLRWSFAMPPPKNFSRYRHWTEWYNREQRKSVRRYFELDYKIWLLLFSEGAEVFKTQDLVKFIKLTNGQY
jgi:hypothetical protein